MGNTQGVVAGAVPFAIGLYWFGSGLLKWFGLRRRWYRQPTPRGARLQALIGSSPLPQLLAGLGLCVAGGSLFVMMLEPLVILVGSTIGPLLIVVGTVFLVYRPAWCYPKWMSTTESHETESR